MLENIFFPQKLCTFFRWRKKKCWTANKEKISGLGERDKISQSLMLEFANHPNCYFFYGRTRHV
jgi:hypothetical protein